MRFSDLVTLSQAFGFEEVHGKGSHRFFKHKQFKTAFLTLQNCNGYAKPYQVKQLLRLVQDHDLKLKD